MAKKIVKRKKIKVFNLLISLLILLGLSFFVYLLFKIPTKNIIIKNTKKIIIIVFKFDFIIKKSFFINPSIIFPP